MRTEILESVVGFFTGQEFKKFNEKLQKGGADLYHAHIYADTSINPFSLMPIATAYYDKHGDGLCRKPLHVPVGPGWSVLYGIHPQPVETAYFEIIMELKPDAGMKPSTPAEYWDKEIMDDVYKKYNFRKCVTTEERQKIADYFKSPWWKKECDVLADSNNVHSHANIHTDVHPLTIKEIGEEVMKQQGRIIDKSISIIWGPEKKTKIVFLSRDPESVLELNWTFEEGALIYPIEHSISDLTTFDMAKYDIEHTPFLVTLTDEEIRYIIDRV